MNFDMFTLSVFDYTTSLFVSIVICILLILAAEFTKACFSSIGPSDSERYEALLRDNERPPYPIAQVCSEHPPYCSHTNYESLSQNFPSPNDPLNEALYELSDTSTDSSYIPGSPHPDDSNLEDELGDTIWFRPRRRHPRIQRVPVSSPNVPKE
jgi:hypothetical protein